MVRLLFMLAAVLVTALAAGCNATVDPDQVNTQPWTTPASWEGTTFGMPY